MAHEQLRFDVLLNTSSTTEKLEYSPIYADQHYGTQYGIFARFFGNKTDSGFKVNELKLMLQNYTGAVSIGIYQIFAMSVENEIAEIYEKSSSDSRLIKLFICLQGLNAKFRESVNIESKDIDFEISEKDILETVVFFAPVENQFSRHEGDNLNLAQDEVTFADSMYFSRDGDLIRRNMEMDEMYNEFLKPNLSSGFQFYDETKIFALESHLGNDKFCRMRVSNFHIK